MKNSITENLERAITTMEAAIKKYKEGDNEIANMRRKEANRLFDSFDESMNSEDESDKTIYGNNINFGKLYEVFESNCEQLFSTEKGKNGVARIMSAIKSDKVLNEQFRVYDALEHNTGKCASETLVNEVCANSGTFKAKELTESNRKLLKLMREAGVDEKYALDSKNDIFYESVETILTTPKTVSNSGIIAEAKQNIVNRLNEQVDIEEKDFSEVGADMMSELAERHAEELTDDEMELVNELTDENTDTEVVFNETKNRLIWKLNEALVKGNGDTEKIKKLSENVKSKAYNKGTAVVDIAEMIESMNIIGE